MPTQRKKIAAIIVTLIVASFALYPRTLSYILLPLVSLGIIGEPFSHGAKFTVKRSPHDLAAISFDDRTWSNRSSEFLPIYFSDLSSSGSSKVVWFLKCVSQENYPVKFLEYGIVPPGWTETEGAQPIIAGHFYEVNNGDVFRKTESGDYERFSRQEYFDMVKKNLPPRAKGPSPN